MQHNAAFHQGLHCFKGKKNLQTKQNNIFLKIITGHPKISTLDYPKCIVSNQKEESISMQRVNLPLAFCSFHDELLRLKHEINVLIA